MTGSDIHNFFTIKPRQRFLTAWRGVLVFCCVLLTGMTVLGQAAETGPEPTSRTREFFNRQEAAAALVIQLDPYESEFESRIYGPGNQLLKTSSVPSLRLGPVIQFIDPVEKARELSIVLTMGKGTGRSRVDMRLIKFDLSGPDASVLMKAYRMLSFGLELEKKVHGETWTMKVASLRQAANYFDYLGMQEMQLWSEFYAAYYLLGVLNDANAAAADARNIEAAATRSGFKTLVLAATGLQGSAALALAVGSSGNTSGKKFEQAQALFTKTAELAQSLDLQYERAHAIYQRGIAYEAARQTSEALSQFEMAMSLATASGDQEYANYVRKHTADLMESQGDNAGAIALMQEISAAAPVEAPASRAEAKPEETAEEEPAQVLPQGEVRATREMATYLFEQGRLQEKTFRHVEAVATLRQAEALNEKSPSVALTGPLSMLLGKALYGAGQPDTALQMLRQGITKTPAARFRNQLEEAHGLVATIERERGDFAAMKAARDAQGMFITEPRDRAAFVFAQALDTAASQGTGSSTARSLLQEAESLARANGPSSMWQLATLELCSLDAQACNVEAARQALASLQASALPEAAFQARWLWIQILRRTGQAGPAQTGLDRLIEDMRFYQAHLPGVLGSWYSNMHEDVFSSAMDMVLSRAGADATGTGADSVAVQALAELGRLSAFDRRQKVSAAEEAEANQLRSLFAGRVEAQTSEAAASIDREAQGLLQQLRSQLAESSSTLGSRSQSLASHLAQLDRNSVLISYYLAAGKAWIWAGGREGLRLVSMPWSPDRTAQLTRTLEGLRFDSASGKASGFTAAMDELGQTLLAPVARYLKPSVYFFPVSRMEGLPFDALRWSGKYLAEKHTVYTLPSLDSLAARHPQVTPQGMQQLFLAGNQLADAGDFDIVKPSSEEVRKVADLFTGPGLHIVQGSALQWDEFQDEHFAQAGLLHLAMPCTIDLRNPGESYLLMSDNIEETGRDYLLPQDIAGKNLQASLVVLSACDFAGSSRTAFDLNTRFPGEFLQAGAGAVIASLWSVGDQAAAEFWPRFYRTLMTTPDVAAALAATKRSYLTDSSQQNDTAWAAFQLYID